MRPIPGFPAPQFTTDGLIGSDPPNQLLEDGVRGYNGFAGTAFGIELHEFIPDENFLATVPNSELAGINNDTRVWRRVSAQERCIMGQCRISGDSSTARGDLNYFNNVKNQLPQCGD